MESAFWVKLGLSFVVGGAWLALTTIVAERRGSRLGGLIGGMPSTVVVALLFVGLTQSPQAVREATTIMPLSQGLNGLFIIAYLLFVRGGLLRGVLGALAVWFLSANALVTLGSIRFEHSLTGWIVLLITCLLVVEKILKVPAHGRVPARQTALEITLRALFGGAVIATAVLAGKLGGPVYAGVGATFPAMFLATLIVTFRTGGADFSRAVARALMVSGMINVPLYAVVARYTFVWVGLLWGTLLALLAAAGGGYLTYRGMRSRQS